MIPEYYSDAHFIKVKELLVEFADVAGEIGCPPSSGDYAEYTLRILEVFRGQERQDVQSK